MVVKKAKQKEDNFVVICAWCKKVLSGNPDKANEISHGICEECSKEFTRP